MSPWVKALPRLAWIRTKNKGNLQETYLGVTWATRKCYMALPHDIFAKQDYVRLKGDNGQNLNAIQAFRPSDDKLALSLEESFNNQSLLEVSEVLAHSFDRWKLTDFW